MTTIIDKNDCCLYRYDVLLVLRNVNGQQIDRVRKYVIQLSKDIGFLIDIETNLKIVNFLDIRFDLNNGTFDLNNGTFDLNNGTFKPYKKPNDSLRYIYM